VAADVPGAARHQDGPEHGGHHPFLLPSWDWDGSPRLLIRATGGREGSCRWLAGVDDCVVYERGEIRE
jgi:hypothetical protein